MARGSSLIHRATSPPVASCGPYATADTHFQSSMRLRRLGSQEVDSGATGLPRVPSVVGQPGGLGERSFPFSFWASDQDAGRERRQRPPSPLVSPLLRVIHAVDR